MDLKNLIGVLENMYGGVEWNFVRWQVLAPTSHRGPPVVVL